MLFTHTHNSSQFVLGSLLKNVLSPRVCMPQFLCGKLGGKEPCWKEMELFPFALCPKFPLRFPRKSLSTHLSDFFSPITRSLFPQAELSLIQLGKSQCSTPSVCPQVPNLQFNQQQNKNLFLKTVFLLNVSGPEQCV